MRNPTGRGNLLSRGGEGADLPVILAHGLERCPGAERMAVPGASTRRSELKSKTATAYRDLLGLPARERRLQRKTYHARYQNMERGDGPRHSWPALPAPARVRPNYRISGRRSGFPRDTRLEPPDRGGWGVMPYRISGRRSCFPRDAHFGVPWAKNKHALYDPRP